MVAERERLTAAITERFGSIHAFCRASGINRTTVYQVLKGTYGGNSAKQLGRIEAALGMAAGAGDDHLPPLHQVEETLRQAACSRCLVTEAPICRRCAPGFVQQAQAVLGLLRRRAGEGRDGA